MNKKETNAYGLSRYVPSSVRRRVRQRCGFGCVVCGCAIVDYHHFDPEFVDAREHREAGITLLCGTCHSRVNKGLLDNVEIGRFNSDPACRKRGFVKDFLFSTRDKIHFQIGGAVFRLPTIITYENRPLIAYAPPTELGGPLRLFATMEDDEEKTLLKIIDNEWRTGIDHFDVETAGKSLVIRRKQRDVTLHMNLNPGGEIVLEKLKMGFRGFKISVNDGWCRLQCPNRIELNLKCPDVHATLRLKSNGLFSM